MKKLYAAWRICTILVGIPLILIQIMKPELLDFSSLTGDASVFGIRVEYLVQVVVVVSELTNSIWKLKEARFYLFSPRMVGAIKWLRGFRFKWKFTCFSFLSSNVAASQT